MFSQFSDFTSFASKLTAELSLDNLQKDEEKEKKSSENSSSLSSSDVPLTLSPSLSLSSSSSQSQPSLTSSILPASSSSSHSSLSSSSSALHLEKSSQKEKENERINQLEVILCEKEIEIQRLMARLSTCQDDLHSAMNRLQSEANMIQSLEESVGQYRVRETDNAGVIQMLEARNKDLELELSDLQGLYQTRFSESQTQTSPCLTCLSYETQIEDLKKNMDTLETNHKTTLESVNKKIVKLQKQNKKLEKDLQIQVTNATKISDVQQSVEESSKLNETPTSVNEFQDESALQLGALSHQLEEKNNQISFLQSSYNQIQAEYQEMKEKQLSLTTKMKEKVKKFIDSQTHLENEKNQLANLLQSKDSEMESLQKKIQILETNLVERKNLSAELADRYSDAQRELKKQKDELTLSREQIAILHQSITAKENQLSEKNEQLLVTEIEVKRLLEMNQAIEELAGQKLLTVQEGNEELKLVINRHKENLEEQNEIIHKLTRSNEDLANKIIVLEKEKGSLVAEFEGKSRTLNEEIEKIRQNSHSFDEYKSRAQKTLKQANTTVNTLTSQLSSCEEEIQKLQNQIHYLQEGNDSKSVEIQRLQSEIEELRKNHQVKVIKFEEEVLLLQENVKKLTQEKENSQQSLEELVKSMSNSNQPPQKPPSSLHLSTSQHWSKSPEVVVLENDEVLLKSDEEAVVITRRKSKLENKLSDLVALDDTGDSARLKVPDHSGDLYIVHQLRETITGLHQEISDQHREIEELKISLGQERENKGKVIRQLEELSAFHERTKKLLNSPESAVNIEYLKKCVYRLMLTKELSEKKRLYPVISVILKFTPQETANVNRSIEEVVAAESDGSWFTPPSLGGLFG